MRFVFFVSILVAIRAGLCVTSTRYTEVPHFNWQNGGPLYSSTGGGADPYGSAALSQSATYSSGVSATGASGGVQYVISGINRPYVSLSLYFSALAGTTQVRVYSGSGTGGVQLGSVNVSYTSPATTLSLSGVISGYSTASIGTITVVVSTPGLAR